MTRQLGILASSGGSVFADMVNITRGSALEYIIIVDRVCGIEEVAKSQGLNCIRIIEPLAENFSRVATQQLTRHGVSACLLFFLRLVGPELFDVVPTYNIHPAFLPFYPGMSAVRRARADGRKFLGATLHRVDAGIDEGPILAQTIRSVNPSWSRERWESISFLQKLYLGLVWAQYMLNQQEDSPTEQDSSSWEAIELNTTFRLNPDWLKAFRLVETREGIRVIAK